MTARRIVTAGIRALALSPRPVTDEEVAELRWLLAVAESVPSRERMGAVGSPWESIVAPLAAPRHDESGTEAMVSEKEAAGRLGVHPKTLGSLRRTGRGPRYAKIGRQIRYRPADIEEWNP